MASKVRVLLQNSDGRFNVVVLGEKERNEILGIIGSMFCMDAQIVDIVPFVDKTNYLKQKLEQERMARCGYTASYTEGNDGEN
ncbi:MAG TPA: hypothetical protein ENH49_00615 [Candidatus Marinimicrobia bacterium]|nr:hypothetical protein [Candidatus Neomarinimicrobiota bacterium]